MSVTTVPDPSEPFEVVIRTTDGTTTRYTSGTGSGVAVAAGVGVGVSVASADVAELEPSLNASAAMTTMATTSTPPAAISQRQPLPYFPDGGAVSRDSDGPGAAAGPLGTVSSALGARNPRRRPAPVGSINTAYERFL